MMAEKYVDYNSIIQDLRERMFSSAVNRLFKEAGLPVPAINERQDSKEECAKAFLIHLATSAFGLSASFKTDLVLGELALLEGYYSGMGMQERRVKFLVESNYHVKGNQDGVDNKDLSYEELSKKAKQFNKTDTPIFEYMIGYFLNSVDDKTSFYHDACEKYLELPAGGHKIRQVRLPVPSYAAKFEKPIKIIPLLPSNDFIGRDDYLSILERNFSEEDGRSIITLHGMDGIGKTEIALQYAYRHYNDYGTVIWIDATNIETLSADCQKILKLDKTTVALDDDDQTALAFCRFIERRHKTLLIFDNADYLMNNVTGTQNGLYWLRKFIPTSSVDVIITTHCDGRIPGTNVLEVFLPDAEKAQELLVRKASRVPDEYTAQLAKKLGYLPLGIEYAGAYIQEMGISYKKYLEKWGRLGASLFDQNDNTATIRDVFHITLEKIKDVPYALSFLQFFSELGINSLPLKEFLNTISRQHFLSMKDLDKHPIYQEIDDGAGKKTLYRIIEVGPDGTEVLEGPDGEHIAKKAEANPLIEYLSSESNRDKLIIALKKYSLVSNNGDMIFVHPLLLEIVFDECHHTDRMTWIKSNCSAGALYETYMRAGSDERAKEQLFDVLHHGIAQLENETKTIPKMADAARANGFNLFNLDSVLLVADSLIAKAEGYGDDELINRCKELRGKLEKVLNDASDVIINNGQ